MLGTMHGVCRAVNTSRYGDVFATGSLTSMALLTVVELVLVGRRQVLQILDIVIWMMTGVKEDSIAGERRMNLQETFRGQMQAIS
jgi:hypothetical protein